MFFLLSSFLFCPPLKNDGRVNCVSSKFLLGFCEKTAEWKPYAVPGHGEGGGEAVGRGKYEQKLKKLGISVSKAERTILTCAFKLAPIASQARHFPPISGEADAKVKRIHSFYYEQKQKILKCLT